MTIGELSAPQGLRFVLFGLVAPFAGGLFLRFGPRRMVAMSGWLLILGLVLTATATSSFQLWVGLGVVLGIRAGADGAAADGRGVVTVVYGKARTGGWAAWRCDSDGRPGVHATRGMDRGAVGLAGGATALGPRRDRDARAVPSVLPRPTAGVGAAGLWRGR
jgi:MFS family permease